MNSLIPKPDSQSVRVKSVTDEYTRLCSVWWGSESKEQTWGLFRIQLDHHHSVVTRVGWSLEPCPGPGPAHRVSI